MQLTDKREPGVHTEMNGDGSMSLVEVGVVTHSRKTCLPGKRVATFALDSQPARPLRDGTMQASLDGATEQQRWTSVDAMA